MDGSGGEFVKGKWLGFVGSGLAHFDLPVDVFYAGGSSSSILEDSPAWCSLCGRLDCHNVSQPAVKDTVDLLESRCLKLLSCRERPT